MYFYCEFDCAPALKKLFPPYRCLPKTGAKIGKNSYRNPAIIQAAIVENQIDLFRLNLATTSTMS